MESVKRNNNFTNADLAMTTGNIVAALRRDATEVATRGVTSTDVDALEAQGNAFEIFPTDEIYQAEIGIVTEEKNSSRESCTDKIQLISGFFEQKWGLNSPYYKQLGIKDLHRTRENDFLVISRRVVSVATTRLADLSAEGLTQADIDGLETEAQTFEDKVHLIFEKTAEREIKTQERTELANALYTELKKYSTVGKLVWENVDEAKYNDYILHKTVHTGLPKPQGLIAQLDVTNPNQVNLIWETVLDATEYELHASQVPQGQPEGEFSLVNTVTIPGDIQIISSGFTYYYKVRARNPLKVSDYSDVVSIELPA